MTCQCPTCGSPMADMGIQLTNNGNMVTTCQGSVRVTPREAKLTRIFLRHPYEFLPHERLYAWLYEGREVGDDAVRRTTLRLRDKVRSIGIRLENQYGVGYRMVLTGQAEKAA